jgi:hypothetical protein
MNLQFACFKLYMCLSYIHKSNIHENLFNMYTYVVQKCYIEVYIHYNKKYILIRKA